MFNFIDEAPLWAIHVASDVLLGDYLDNKSCIISENIINSGYYSDNAGTKTLYKYLDCGLGGSYGYINVQSSCTIFNNSLRGIGSVAGNRGKLIRVGGVDSIITNNKVYREAITISKYIDFYNYSQPSYITAAGIVTNNYFDSTTVDGASTSLYNIPSNFIYKYGSYSTNYNG